MAGSPNIFSMLYQKMNWLNHQFSTAAENIENASVPGWDRRVLQPLSFKKTMEANASAPRITNEKHLQGFQGAQDFKMSKDKIRVTTLSGNSVKVEQELQTLNVGSIQHKEMTAIYKQLTNILKLPLKS